ncbi:inositol monophosphatase family protein [Synechococcus elongatus]|uniref:Inositol monophosphatase family protein n=1 Tax=Synechococcus elongatus PCC 11801 TaxID=2219813 RepID=A0AAN1QPL4_SYNEL|nr:inositol monophosphatase family protein [Synechococcus elongatus]AZB73183.1 inositol monophosphatase [Synechococcus elongatus PCC 11801]
MTQPNWRSLAQTIEALCQTVGDRLLEEFGTLQATEKEDGSLITAADRWADQTLRDRLTQLFPDHALLTEESHQTFGGSDWTWVVDPLDGTTNFAQGIPLWGISLALLYRGLPVFGAIALPPLNRFYCGVCTTGTDLAPAAWAERNGQPLKLRQTPLGSNQLFSLCTRSAIVLQRRTDPFPCKIRMLGASTANFLTVLEGTTLGALEATPKVWDIAAVWVLAQALGADWQSLSGQQFPLQAGQDYGAINWPTLLLARPDLTPAFGIWATLLS